MKLLQASLTAVLSGRLDLINSSAFLSNFPTSSLTSLLGSSSSLIEIAPGRKFLLSSGFLITFTLAGAFFISGCGATGGDIGAVAGLSGIAFAGVC
jgi:hypothetical protein